MSFSAQLKSAIGKQQGWANRVWKRAVVDAFVQVQIKTPVGDPSLWQSPAPAGYVGGSARASWLIGDANDGAIGATNVSINGQKIPDIGGSVLMYSNIPYIERLEDGWSSQAPNGMVKTTIANWPTIVARYERSI